MAFRMNRPIIKGTANHKASVAKATQQSIVSQARTTADASLVGAGKSLGESYIPAAMDYTINQKGIEFADVKKEGGEGKSSKPKKMKKEKLKVKTKGPDLKKRITPEYNPPKEEGLPTDYIKPPKKERGENIFEKGYKSIRDKIKKGNERKLKNRQAAQAEKERIQAEKDAAYVGKGDTEPANQKYKDSPGYKEMKRKEHAAKVKELNILQKEKDAADKAAAEAKAKQMKKKEVITVEPLILGGVGEQGIANYTKEQLKTINDGGGTWSDEAGREVLKEEMVDGKYVPLNSGVEILESNKFSGSNQTNATPEPVVEKKKTTTSNARQRRLDKKYKNAGPSVRANMIADGYVPSESKNPATMRDNRIYRNAIKGGVVQQNMIKSGYKPE